MATDLLTPLDLDTERLLFAGAGVARKDADLAAHRDQLAPLAAKAPALARVTEQVEKVQRSSGTATSEELLNLSALMAQARRAQAAPRALDGELTALAPLAPIESPLAPNELSAFIDILTNAEGTTHRARAIEEGLARGTLLDLRLLPFFPAALADNGIASVVEDKLLPALGEAIVPELLASLQLAGKTADVRKLRALVAIQQAAAKPLLHQVMEKGSPELQAAALLALARIAPAEAEPLALRRLESSRPEDVGPAIEALGACATDGALEALLATFAGADPEEKERFDQLLDALGKTPHPDATARILALLTPELRALAPFEWPKGPTPPQQAARAFEEHRRQVERLESVVRLLARRRDERAIQAISDVLRSHRIDRILDAAAEALIRSRDPRGLEAIAESGRINAFTQIQFVNTCLAQPKDRAFALLGRFLDPAMIGKREREDFIGTAEYILARLEELAGGQPPSPVAADPRWAQAASKLSSVRELAGAVKTFLQRTAKAPGKKR